MTFEISDLMRPAGENLTGLPNLTGQENTMTPKKRGRPKKHPPTPSPTRDRIAYSPDAPNIPTINTFLPPTLSSTLIVQRTNPDPGTDPDVDSPPPPDPLDVIRRHHHEHTRQLRHLLDHKERLLTQLETLNAVYFQVTGEEIPEEDFPSLTP